VVNAEYVNILQFYIEKRQVFTYLTFTWQIAYVYVFGSCEMRNIVDIFIILLL